MSYTATKTISKNSLPEIDLADYKMKLDAKASAMLSGSGAFFRPKDPMSALTHFIGFWMAIVGMPFLLTQGAQAGLGRFEMLSLSVFMMSMILLYGASTSYHTFHLSEKAEKRLKKLDHMMIFVLIAGSYTPVCVVVLANGLGLKLLAIIWTMAAMGMIFKACWVTCPKWVSSVIYIGMGWTAIFFIVPLMQIFNRVEFSLLLAGGILYTIGGVIYALKWKISENFGEHELFHVFVLLGSLSHYLMLFVFLF